MRNNKIKEVCRLKTEPQFTTTLHSSNNKLPATTELKLYCKSNKSYVVFSINTKIHVFTNENNCL